MRVLAMLGVLALGAAAHADGRRPVVVELFSSEGCSSCPAADAVLAALDREPNVGGAEVIALELHVDYWNRLGWTDPFSSSAFSERQGEYARAMQRDGVYTPQAVIDGSAEVIGSDADGLRARIASAARAPAARVTLSRKGEQLAASVSALPPGADAESEVWLALSERNLATDVPRGENGGRHLAHGPVVRRLQKLGQLRAGAFQAEVPLAVPRGVKLENARAVLFVQERESRRIVGAATLSLR